MHRGVSVVNQLLQYLKFKIV